MNHSGPQCIVRGALVRAILKPMAANPRAPRNRSVLVGLAMLLALSAAPAWASLSHQGISELLKGYNPYTKKDEDVDGRDDTTTRGPITSAYSSSGDMPKQRTSLSLSNTQTRWPGSSIDAGETPTTAPDRDDPETSGGQLEASREQHKKLLQGGLLDGIGSFKLSGARGRGSGPTEKSSAKKDGRIDLSELSNRATSSDSSESDIKNYRKVHDSFKAAEESYRNGDHSEKTLVAFQDFLAMVLTNSTKIQRLAEQASRDGESAELAKTMIKDAEELRKESVEEPRDLLDKISKVRDSSTDALLIKAIELDALNEVLPWANIISLIARSEPLSNDESQDADAAKEVLAEINKQRNKHAPELNFLYGNYSGPPPDGAPTQVELVIKFYRQYWKAAEQAEKKASALSATEPQKHELRFFIEIWPLRERLQWMAQNVLSNDEAGNTATAKDILGAWKEVQLKLQAVLDEKTISASTTPFSERFPPPPASSQATDRNSEEGREVSPLPSAKRQTIVLKSSDREVLQKGKVALEKRKSAADVDGDLPPDHSAIKTYQESVRCLIPTLQGIAANEGYDQDKRARAEEIINIYKENRTPDDGPFESESYEDCSLKTVVPVAEPAARFHEPPKPKKPRNTNNRFFKSRVSDEPLDPASSDMTVTAEDIERYSKAYHDLVAVEGNRTDDLLSAEIFAARANFLSTILPAWPKIFRLAEDDTPDSSTLEERKYIQKIKLDAARINQKVVHLLELAIDEPINFQQKIAHVIKTKNNEPLLTAAELDYLDETLPWEPAIKVVAQAKDYEGKAQAERVLEYLRVLKKNHRQWESAIKVVAQAKDYEGQAQAERVLEYLRVLKEKHRQSVTLYNSLNRSVLTNIPKFAGIAYRAYVKAAQKTEKDATALMLHELDFFAKIWPLKRRLQHVAQGRDASAEPRQDRERQFAQTVLGAWDKIYHKLRVELDFELKDSDNTSERAIRQYEINQTEAENSESKTLEADAAKRLDEKTQDDLQSDSPPPVSEPAAEKTQKQHWVTNMASSLFSIFTGQRSSSPAAQLTTNEDVEDEARETTSDDAIFDAWQAF